MNRSFQFALCTALLIGLCAVSGSAQVINSGTQTVTLTATLTESISVNLSTNAVSFTLTAGSATNNGSNGVTATTNWISRPGRNVNVYAYFSSSAAALSDGAGNNIPSADFLVSNNAGAYTPLTSTVAYGAASAGLQLSTTKITGLNKIGNHVDNMLFRIDLSTLPALPPGIYAGTLNIQAQVI